MQEEREREIERENKKAWSHICKVQSGPGAHSSYVLRSATEETRVQAPGEETTELGGLGDSNWRDWHAGVVWVPATGKGATGHRAYVVSNCRDQGVCKRSKG